MEAMQRDLKAANVQAFGASALQRSLAAAESSPTLLYTSLSIAVNIALNISKTLKHTRDSEASSVGWPVWLGKV